MARKRKHRGVSIISPNATSRNGYRLRYVDPDSGKTRWETIDSAVYKTARDREDLAVRRAEQLANRKRELDMGATKVTGTPLTEAIERFYRNPPRKIKRESTLDAHSLGTNRLLEWAETRRPPITTSDELTRPLLIEFSAYVAKVPKHYDTNGQRSLATVNKEVRSVRRVLGHLIDMDLCARLTHDDLRRALPQVEAATEKRDYLRPNELRKLIEACERHDAATYSMTRREKDDGKGGGTPRYEPISAFVLFLTLSGMRRDEALSLKWSDVDLDALDHEGRKVGEVYVRGADSKTHKHRTVDLGVSPALRRLLTVMRLKSGGKGPVFDVTKDGVIKAMRRLRKTYGAPSKFTYQTLRVSCSTYLTNSPGIFGAASAHLSARQLGHSVTIAEKHYTGLIRGISPKHRTLEGAMQIESEVEAVIERVEQRRAA